MLWRATLRDVHERATAFNWHERRTLEHHALLAHWLLCAWVEHPPTPAQLLGDSHPAETEALLDRVTGAVSPEEQHLQNLDRAYAKQAARKATP